MCITNGLFVRILLLLLFFRVHCINSLQMHRVWWWRSLKKGCDFIAITCTWSIKTIMHKVILRAALCFFLFVLSQTLYMHILYLHILVKSKNSNKQTHKNININHKLYRFDAKIDGKITIWKCHCRYSKVHLWSH